MNASDNSAAYTGTAIALHWLTVLLICGLVPLGLYMTGLPVSPTKLRLYSYHKWAGVTLVLLAFVRLVWRLGHPPPPLPPTMPYWQQRLATATHHLLYVLMLAIPLSGWTMSSAKGVQTVWFGVLPLPDLVGKSEALGDLLKNLHVGLNSLLALLLVGHVLAALKHHFVDRDDVLLRMLPRDRKTARPPEAEG